MTVVTTIGTEPDRIDIEAVAGKSIDFTVPVYDSANALQDVTTWGVSAPVWAGDVTAVLHELTLTTVAPTGTPGDADYDPGGVRVTASSADTTGWLDWPVTVARWVLWLTPPASDPYPFAAGWVRVHKIPAP